MKDDKVYLEHILKCISNIESYTKSGKDEFIKSQLIQDAVIRNLEIIGEATKKVSHELRQKEQNIPWREMAGLRDVLIHDYFGVDLKIVWNVVGNELPRIRVKVDKLLKLLKK